MTKRAQPGVTPANPSLGPPPQMSDAGSDTGACPHGSHPTPLFDNRPNTLSKTGVHTGARTSTSPRHPGVRFLHPRMIRAAPSCTGSPPPHRRGRVTTILSTASGTRSLLSRRIHMDVCRRVSSGFRRRAWTRGCCIMRPRLRSRGRRRGLRPRRARRDARYSLPRVCPASRGGGGSARAIAFDANRVRACKWFLICMSGPRCPSAYEARCGRDFRRLFYGFS